MRFHNIRMSEPYLAPRLTPCVSPVHIYTQYGTPLRVSQGRSVSAGTDAVSRSHSESHIGCRSNCTLSSYAYCLYTCELLLVSRFALRNCQLRQIAEPGTCEAAPQLTPHLKVS